MARHNVMILAAGAGNGHNRAGQALKKAFVTDDRVRQAMFVDCLNYTNEAFKEMYSHFFIEAVKKAPTLWGWAFDKTDVPWRDVNFREFFERINAILRDKTRLEHMQQAAGRLVNANAAAQIVNTILEKSHEPPVKISKMNVSG